MGQISANPKNKIIDFKELNTSGKVAIKYKTIDEQNNSIGSLVRFASYIAAKSRTNLAIGMRAVGYENVYYCDTDSIFTCKQLPAEMID